MERRNVSIEMNTKLAQRMEDVCDDLGLTMEEAFQIFANRMVREDGIPFEVTEEDYPKDEKIETLKKIAICLGTVAAVFSLIKVISKLVRRK